MKYADDASIDRAISALVAQAERVVRRQFPARAYPDLHFSDPRWDLSPKGVAKTTRGNVALFYVIDGSGKRIRMAGPEADVLPKEFADVAKTWLVLANMSAAYMAANSMSLRYLAHSLLKEPMGQRMFRWDRLTEHEFVRAARYIEQTYPASASHHESAWACFLKWLQQNEIVHDGLEWTPTARRVDVQHSAKNRAARRDRLPRAYVLSALGEVYHKATSAMDRFLICALGVLFVTGFRSGELFTLPVDCWVEEASRGRTRCGIRYWKEKDKRGTYRLAVRWLSPLGAELARECLHEIRAITERARAQAAVLEGEPDRVRIPEVGRKTILSRAETASALDVKIQALAGLIRDGYIQIQPREIAYRRWVYDRKDVEAELLRRRPPLVVVQISPDRVQTLSETLLISFVYETDPQATTSRLLVRRLPESALHIFIGAAKAATPSAFERFGLNDPFKLRGVDPLKFRIHAVRHWLNTVANNAGMTAFQITIWMQRATTDQTLLYLHDTSDIADYTRELARSGNVVGTIADQYVSLRDPAEKESFLNTIEESHIGATGICCRSFRTQRCIRHKACESVCEYSLTVIGDRRPVEALKKKRSQLEAAIARNRAIARMGTKVVGRQQRVWKDMINEIDRKLIAAESV